MDNNDKVVLSNEYKFKIGDTFFAVTLDNSFKEKKIFSFKKEILSSRLVHYHSTNELFFVPKSQLLINTDNEQIIFSNCVLNICPFFKHYTVRLIGAFRLLFSYTKKGNGTPCYLQYKELFSSNMTAYKINKHMINQLEYINTIPFSNEYIYSETVCSSLKIIFLEFLKLNSKTNKVKTTSRNDNYLFQIEQILSSKYMDDVNLTYVAKILHLSTKQVSRIITKNYKVPLNVLVTKRRLQVASGFLLETNLNINKIVEEINFKSLNYFFVCFKNEFGMSPTQYRKANVKL